MSEPAVQEGTLRVALERDIVRKSDEYDQSAQQYADQLVGARLDKSQIRGPETLSSAADKVSDITDWLKLRTGRDSGRDRRVKDGIVRDLVNELERLRNDAKKIVQGLGQGDPDLERQVHLLPVTSSSSIWRRISNT